ncbi:hypothetical protein V9K67_18750 [Paraflavisolibacter sp. H34]|uniref:hypothetical protein n=1 Tax=Huijunlia imazamoxiresistens TaxID=3127457 RepID=UPI00301A910C
MLISLLNLLPAAAQADRCDTIYWQEGRPLEWADFRGVPDLAARHESVTSYTFEQKAWIQEDTFRIFLRSAFNPCRSWTKSTASLFLLQHERTHFDIVEYCKRLLAQRLLQASFTPVNAFDLLRRLTQEAEQEKERMQERYDAETSFSINRLLQEKWSADIRLKLRALEPYARSWILRPLPE